MAAEASLEDPLSGISGLLHFPRTIRPSADVPMPADPKDLDSIHNFMKSLELRSPERVMNEAKRIVDGGAEFLESKFGSFAENMAITDAIAAKGKDRPEERRPGLRLARKRAKFSLKTSVSQPSVRLEPPTLDIDHLQDPDEFFDAYERIENAKKEIQKQLGGSVDNVNLYKPSNTARRRRPGILGKSYNYKHRYSSEPSENDMLMASQETVDQDNPSGPEDESQEKLVHPDPNPNPDADLEEVEPDVSMKKKENEVSDILEELLSCNNEDLEGDGAFNLLQEKLKIKPLDLGNLYITELPDVGRTSISTVTDSLQKPCRSSLVIDSVLKNLTMKSPASNPVNPVSSPTPPRSPFASLSLLKKRILQPNSLRDPFSPTVDLSACRNGSPAQPKDKLLEQVDVPKGLGMSNQLESRVVVDNAEPTVSNMDTEKVMENADSLPEQFVNENAVQSSNADSRTHEESGNNIEKTMNTDDNGSKPSELEDEARDDTSSRRPNDLEQQPEEHQAKLTRGNRVAGGKRIRKAHPMRKSLAGLYIHLHAETRIIDISCFTNYLYAGTAESGTSFETGVRRSKRIRMRPLEYWKGERFLYGRVDNSLKLIGVKYLSPGKDTANLKVEPYIPSQSPEYKELLELAARH
ncbi:Centromere protein C [Sesamum alatum]|uniref:Centromere protein C n=1 Tax=Sesamum alatum TaxID=300844 RepID=A0AAE1YEB2_9LAMI|nr:Centromere protein C [Sesamum alatum]